MELESTSTPMLLSEELEGSLNVNRYGQQQELDLIYTSKSKDKDAIQNIKLSSDMIQAVKKLSKREKKREEQIAVSKYINI
mgnify:CR=1 FL=1